MHARNKYILAIIVALITFIVYLPALQNDFVLWDDDVNVYENIHLRSLDLTFIKWALSGAPVSSWEPVSYWQPLVWISHALDYAMWGLNPAGHHLTSVLLHSINTLLVVLLVITLISGAGTPMFPSLQKRGPSQYSETRAMVAAGGVAGLLFGLHPIHVESVAWVTERKDLVYSLFFLLSILAYVRFITSLGPEGTDGSPRACYRNKYYYGSLFMFCLAAASKPMAVTLPVVLLILDWYPFGRAITLRKAGALLVEKTPFLLISAAVSMATLYTHVLRGAALTLQESSCGERVLTAARAATTYLRKMVMPVDLSPYYPDLQASSFWSFEYYSNGILVCGITMLCIYAAKKQKILLAAWGAYIIMLLPVSGLVRTQSLAIADRFFYLPSVGPILLAGVGVAWLCLKIDFMGRWKTILIAAAVTAAFVLCNALVYSTHTMIAVWKNSITLWSFVIDREPTRAVTAYLNRGAAFGAAGRTKQALADFNTAIDLDSTVYQAYNNRGDIERELGQLDRAEADYTKAIMLNPDFYTAYNGRGRLLKDAGKFQQAIADYTTAIALKHDFSEAYTNRGILYAETARPNLALNDFTSAISINPYYADAYTARGLVLINLGHPEQALQDLNKAVSLKPVSVEARLNRGVAYERMGKLQNALEDYSTAITLNPADYLVYNNRGNVFARLNNREKAVEDQTTSISLRPDFAKAYVDRAEVYTALGKRWLAKSDYQKACQLGSTVGCVAVRRISP